MYNGVITLNGGVVGAGRARSVLTMSQTAGKTTVTGPLCFYAGTVPTLPSSVTPAAQLATQLCRHHRQVGVRQTSEADVTEKLL